MFLDKNVNTEVLHFCSNGLFGIEVTFAGRRKFPFGESIVGATQNSTRIRDRKLRRVMVIATHRKPTLHLQTLFMKLIDSD